MKNLKPNLLATAETLLCENISRQEIKRKTGDDRKAIRQYSQLDSFVADQGDICGNNITVIHIQLLEQ